MKTLSESNIYKISAIISYIIGYIYIKYVVVIDVFGAYEHSFWMIAFSILFILWTEGFAYLLGNTYEKLKETGKSVIEPIILIVCILLQAVAISVWKLHEDWQLYQVFIWHGTIIYYVISRMGILAAGRSGMFFPIDCFSGAVIVPLSNFILRAKKILAKENKTAEETPSKKRFEKKDIGIIITSVFVALIVCSIAISQLVSVSSTFAGLGEGFDRVITGILSADSIEYFFSHIFIYVILSIPFGCWLFALVAGSMQKELQVPTDKQLEEETKSFHSLPSYSAYIIIGSVCALYAIFFVSAFVDILNGNFALTAQEACSDAVGSFWQLIKVVVLNMAVMFASCFFSKKALWTEKGTRILSTVLFVFALAFALLAAWNLVGVYIAVYGITPRRILSSWVVINIITWCVLILVRLYKKIPAAQIGIMFAAVSFSLVVCGNF